MQTDWKQTATAVQVPNFNDNQRPPEASRYTGVSESKLAKLRMTRYRHLGPKFVRAAGCIIYRKSDLDEWLASHLIEASDGEGA